MSLSSSGRVLGLEWSLHRHGEHSEENKDGDWRRRIELCYGNYRKQYKKNYYYQLLLLLSTIITIYYY